jgi:hypothetical protein
MALDSRYTVDRECRGEFHIAVIRGSQPNLRVTRFAYERVIEVEEFFVSA